MKLLLDGSLNQSLQLKDLLTGISQAEAPGLTVLKFTAHEKECGELYFLGGHYIVYASSISTPATGTAAFDELFKLKEANFNYYACDSVEALPQSDNLKIDLKELIAGWLETTTVSEGQLLDKIFNVPTNVPASATKTPTQARIPAIPVQPIQKEQLPVEDAFAGVETSDSSIHTNPVESSVEPSGKASPHGAPRDDMAWEMVEPLVSSGAPGSGTNSSDWEESEESLTVTQNVRSLSKGWQWQRGIRKIVIALMVLLIIFTIVLCSLWWFMNAPSAHLGPRRYSVPMQKHYLHRAP